MSWKDNLREASFRDVPFFVESVSTEVGRRNVLYEYPFRDDPYIEDLGKAAGVYNVTGYVIQNADNDFDYFTERDNLIAALEAEVAAWTITRSKRDLEEALDVLEGSHRPRGGHGLRERLTDLLGQILQLDAGRGHRVQRPVRHSRRWGRPASRVHEAQVRARGLGGRPGSDR